MCPYLPIYGHTWAGIVHMCPYMGNSAHIVAHMVAHIYAHILKNLIKPMKTMVFDMGKVAHISAHVVAHNQCSGKEGTKSSPVL